MKKFVLSILFAIIIIFNNLSQTQNRNWLPTLLAQEEIVHHKYYSLAYFEAYELPSWVAYELTSEMASGNLPYKPKFIVDNNISTNSATPKDYESSGYVMAQLVPINDMRFSEEAIKESFFMSTIAPQKIAFNKYTWEKLNNLVNAWAKERGRLLIVSGPVLKDAPFPVIGKNKVSVPLRFYKVIFDPEKFEGIGFVIPNHITTGSLSPYAMPIRKVEEITGLNFFSYLEDDIEERVENEPFDSSKWNIYLFDKK